MIIDIVDSRSLDYEDGQHPYDGCLCVALWNESGSLVDSVCTWDVDNELSEAIAHLQTLAGAEPVQVLDHRGGRI